VQTAADAQPEVQPGDRGRCVERCEGVEVTWNERFYRGDGREWISCGCGDRMAWFPAEELVGEGLTVE
jgi:hypothetical protein